MWRSICDSCYSITHRSGTKKRHTFKEIEVVKEVLRDAEEYCSVCAASLTAHAIRGDPFCKRCFEETHKSANKRGIVGHRGASCELKGLAEINDAVSGQILYFNAKTRVTQAHKHGAHVRYGTRYREKTQIGRKRDGCATRQGASLSDAHRGLQLEKEVHLQRSRSRSKQTCCRSGAIF